MQVIRDLLTPKTYVIVVEHDLAVLDYLSDFICCLYGKPGVTLTYLLCVSARHRRRHMLVVVHSGTAAPSLEHCVPFSSLGAVP